jgi:acyl-CoA thioester hydrolase
VEQPAADQAVFRCHVRVYFEDTDAAGVVYYANYLKFFERCRSEWLRALGVGQHRLAADERLRFVVADLAVRFQRPARLDDLLTIEAALAERTRSFLVFAQRALRGDELLASARVKVACVDALSLAPVRLPRQLVERFAAPAAAAA